LREPVQFKSQRGRQSRLKLARSELGIELDRRRDGSELERFGETYVLRDVNRGWKIITAMVQDPGAVLALA
jgi:hypothetical protein